MPDEIKPGDDAQEQPESEVEDAEVTEEEPEVTVEEEPDITDAEDLDEEIEVVGRAQGRRGCGAFGWVIVILALAAALIYGGTRYQTYCEEMARQDHEERMATYQTTEGGISNTVKAAAALAAGGEVTAAFSKLAAAEKKWSELGAGANSAGEVDYARYASSRADDLTKVVKELAEERKLAAGYAKEAAALAAKAKALAEKRDVVNLRVCERIEQLAAGGADAAEAEAIGGQQPQAAKAESKKAKKTEKKAETKKAKKTEKKAETEKAKKTEKKAETKKAKKTEKKAAESKKKAAKTTKTKKTKK